MKKRYLSRKPQVFISYAHEGADDETIKLFEGELRQQANNTIDIYVDKRRILPGQSVSAFEKMIDAVDAVIILMTPQYKSKISRREGGVYREYGRILARLDASIETLRSGGDGDTFALQTILFSGNSKDSIPDGLSDLLWLDFREFVSVEHPNTGNSIVSDSTRRKFAEPFRQLFGVISHGQAVRGEEFQLDLEQKRQIILFEHKHEAISSKMEKYGAESYLDEIFVKTRSFRSVLMQNSVILVGRKGSGKSTIVDHLFRQSAGAFLSEIQVHADDFNLELLYSLVYSPRYLSDINAIFTMSKFFQIGWKIFIYLRIIKILLDLCKNKKLEVTDDTVFVLDKFLKTDVNSESTDADTRETNVWPDFVWAVSSVISLVDETIDHAPDINEKFFRDLSKLSEPDHIINKIFGDEVLEQLASALSQLQRPFVLTLDGFDSEFDEFRRATIQGSFTDEQKFVRNSIETNWLKGLLRAVLDIRSGNSIVSDQIVFCLTIPKDRFIEIRESERDDYRYRAIYSDIQWSGVEMAILLHKRIEVIFSLEKQKKLSPLDRFSQDVRQAYPEIPLRLNFKIGATNVETTLFTYLLRHTFWRPRDILLLFSQVVATVETLRKRKRVVNVETVRQAVARGTYDIVTSEFINEFQSVCLNIKEIILGFERKTNILSFSKLTEIVDRVQFHFVEPKLLENTNLEEKVRFLYEIGFIGFSVPNSPRPGEHFRFFFADGDHVFESSSTKELSKADFAIHPVFNEYLRLSVDDQRLVNFYSDKFLQENDL